MIFQVNKKKKSFFAHFQGQFPKNIFQKIHHFQEIVFSQNRWSISGKP